MSEGEGFLGRWSRRKRAAAVAPPAPPVPVPPVVVPPAEAPMAAPPVEFDPASLPPVESLTAESDITGFLRPQVPAALRTAALRRAWTLDPAIRDYVGPADYAWDFNAEQGMAGFSLELGGDVKRLLAQAIGLVEEEEEEEEAEQVAAAMPAEPPAIMPPESEAPPPALVAEAAPPEAEPSPAPAAPVRRHGGARPV
ncbi:MAG: DUF3306 domain-containing protein [Paracraurococcus sp.]